MKKNSIGLIGYLLIIVIQLTLPNKQTLASEYNKIDDETQLKLKLCAKASERSYGVNEKDRIQDDFLYQNYFDEFSVKHNSQQAVQTVAWLNEDTHQLIIANRGTVITEPKNIWADVGILEAIVREKNKHLSTPPSGGEEIFTFLTDLIQNNIRRFQNNPRFNLKYIQENWMINEILNPDRLYIRARNTYMLGGAGVGTGIGLLGMGALAIAMPLAAPVAVIGSFILGAGAGAGIGGAAGNNSLNSKLEKNILKPARVSLCRTLNTMYTHTVDIIKEANNRGKAIEEIILTGHSLGGEGTLAVASRLNPLLENKVDLNCFVFNAPGGHKGVVKIWQQEAGLKNWNECTMPIYHAHRSSCIIANAGIFPRNTMNIDFGGYYKYNSQAIIKDWYETRLDEHGIIHLNTTIHHRKF